MNNIGVSQTKRLIKRGKNMATEVTRVIRNSKGEVGIRGKFKRRA